MVLVNVRQVETGSRSYSGFAIVFIHFLNKNAFQRFFYVFFLTFYYAAVLIGRNTGLARPSVCPSVTYSKLEDAEKKQNRLERFSGQE